MGIFGHCSVAFAIKPVSPKAPLGVLLLAALFLDILATALVLSGIEGDKPGITWSHSLFMAMLWSGGAGLVSARIFHSTRAGVAIGLVVFSHWVLDFISHPIPFSTFSWRSWQWDFGHPLPPDLPLLFSGSPKVGLGLYNAISAIAATVLELGMLALGIAWYARSIVKRGRVEARRWAGNA